MDFKKIDEQKFQCILYEEDLEENDISLDDFFKNDKKKIHDLIDVVMEEAHKVIDVDMDGAVLSLQLAPQANHSIMLTISSGQDDFANMLRQAGERAAKALSGVKPRDNSKGNVIKNGTEEGRVSPIPPFESLKEQLSATDNNEKRKNGTKNSTKGNLVKPEFAVFTIASLVDFENMCRQMPRTWGLKNRLYKDEANDRLYFVMEKGKCSDERYRCMLNILMEYGEYDSYTKNKVGWIYEHCKPLIAANAINVVKKYMCS